MVAWILSSCLAPAPPPGPPVTLESELRAMVDRDAARRRVGALRGASSHDPDGEDDRGRYLRTERHGDREEHVLLDEPGPGVMVRLSSLALPVISGSLPGRVRATSPVMPASRSPCGLA